MKKSVLCLLLLLVLLNGCGKADVSMNDVLPKKQKPGNSESITTEITENVTTESTEEVTTESTEEVTTESTSDTVMEETTEIPQTPYTATEDSLVTITKGNQSSKILIPRGCEVIAQSYSSVIVTDGAEYTYTFPNIYNVVDDALAEKELREWFVTCRSSKPDMTRSEEFGRLVLEKGICLYSLWVSTDGETSCHMIVNDSVGNYVSIIVPRTSYSEGIVESLCSVALSHVK